LENVILGTTVVGEITELKAIPTGLEEKASITNAVEIITFHGNNVLLKLQKRFQVISLKFSHKWEK